MSDATTGGLRKLRAGFFVPIPRDTMRDKRLSFKARGLLGYLLDMPEGWDVRSEYLATQGKEGRDAVQTGLKELRKYGYYRLERRRLLDGRIVMGTAVSESPVQQWIDESAEFDDKAVLCIQQPNGSFKVKHRDGSLTNDGFEAMPADPELANVQPSTQSMSVVEGAGPTTPTGTGFSGPGKSDSGFSDSGSPDFGSSDSGKPGALRKKETKDLEERDSTADAAPGDTTLFEHNDTPALAEAASSQPERKTTRNTKGTRIPEDFEVTDDMRQWAQTNGFGNWDLKAVTEEFFDYWVGVPGAKGVKTDWVATWRNWLRRNNTFNRGGSAASTTTSRNEALWAKAQRRQARPRSP